MAKRTQDGRTKPVKDDITCKQATSLIMDYLTGELDSETTSAFEKHLKACQDCLTFLNTYKKTIQLTRSFLHKK